MAGGKTFPHEDLPRDYYSGQKHIAHTDDDYPDLHEVINTLRSNDGAVKRGKATVVAGLTLIAVVFTTAFPAASDVTVRLTAQASNVNCFVTAITVNGFTANISAILGADEDVAWEAVAV